MCLLGLLRGDQWRPPSALATTTGPRHLNWRQRLLLHLLLHRIHEVGVIIFIITDVFEAAAD
jgi:hypothetical protein